MKNVTMIAATVMMLGTGSTAAGEWGNGGYQGKNDTTNYTRRYGGHSVQPTTRVIPVVRPYTYQFSCGVECLKNGRVVTQTPPMYDTRQMNTTYRQFYGRAPVVRGVGPLGYILLYRQFLREMRNSGTPYTLKEKI